MVFRKVEEPTKLVGPICNERCLQGLRKGQMVILQSMPMSHRDPRQSIFELRLFDEHGARRTTKYGEISVAYHAHQVDPKIRLPCSTGFITRVQAHVMAITMF